MARVCQVTGKKPMAGHNVSHANGLRTIDKNGIDAVLKELRAKGEI